MASAWGGVPWGWRVGADGVHLEPNEGERATADRAAMLRREGLSFAQVAAQFATEGRVKRSGRAFRRSEVHALCGGERRALRGLGSQQ